MFMFWLLVTSSRFFISHQAWLDIQSDLLLYEDEWRCLNDDDETRSSLRNLAQVSTEIAVQITRNFNDEHFACIQQTLHRYVGTGLPANVNYPFAGPLGSDADGLANGRGGGGNSCQGGTRRMCMTRYRLSLPTLCEETFLVLSCRWISYIFKHSSYGHFSWRVSRSGSPHPTAIAPRSAKACMYSDLRRLKTRESI